jgi:hypothetical protein
MRSAGRYAQLPSGTSAFSGTVDVVDIYIDLDIDNIDHSHS